MRENKLMKKIGAIALSIAMMIAFTVGMISPEKAYADQQGKAKLVKSIDVDTGVFLPEMNFTFEANPGDAAEATDQLQAVYAGVPEAVTIAPVNVPESTEINKKDTIEVESAITVDPNKFTKPGIYRYVVTEVPGNIEGMVYDDTELTLDVYVANKEGGGYEVVGYVIVDKDTQKKLGDGNAKFNNIYKHDGGEDSLKNMVVTKNVTGNLGDKNKLFSFTVEVEKAGDGDVFTLVKPDGSTEAFKQGQTVTMNLKHNDSFTIKGLSKTDAIKVEEANYKADGYNSSINIGDSEAVSDGSSVSVKGSKDANIIVTNSKNADTPTGIFFHYAPYIALIAVAGGLLMVFRRRKEDK